MMDTKKIILKNSYGKVVQVKAGYSFTTLVFSWLPDLLRGNFKNFLKLFIALFATAVFMLGSGGGDIANYVMLGIQALWAMKRNKFLLEAYLEKGYTISSLKNMSEEELEVFIGYKVDTNLGA